MEVKTPLGNIDLKRLAEDIQGRGIELPALVRLTDVLQNRIQELATAFNQTITERKYQGQYRGVYPRQSESTATTCRRGNHFLSLSIWA